MTNSPQPRGHKNYFGFAPRILAEAVRGFAAPGLGSVLGRVVRGDTDNVDDGLGFVEPPFGK
jgi:hypothetical protein